MAYELTEAVYKRGMLTRKAIRETQSAVLERLSGATERGRFCFDEFRQSISAFALARRKSDRGKIIVALDTIGWTGVFNARDIAEILLTTDDKQVAEERALTRLKGIEKSYEDNERKAEIVRKLIAKVVPSTICSYEMTVDSVKVDVRFYPSIKRGYDNVLIEGAENIYAFLQTLRRIMPRLKAAHIKYGYKTLQTIHSVWSMGESTYCYNYSLETTGRNVLKAQSKSYHDYFADYELPFNIKAAILDGVRHSISSVKWGVYYSQDGGSYNSLVRSPIPDKGGKVA